MSGGATNWPFLTLMARPVSAAAMSRSVWRQRKAGIWRTASTGPRAWLTRAQPPGGGSGSLWASAEGGNCAVGGEEKGGGAGAVGAEGFYAGLLEALEDFVAGVAEGVAAAGADDGLARGGGGEEFRVGGRTAAVVADL